MIEQLDENADSNIFSTAGEVIDAQAALGGDSTFYKWRDARKVDAANAYGEKIDPITLNQEYPDTEVLFSEPMTRNAADIIYKKNKEVARLHNVVEKGIDGFWNNVPGTLANMGMTMLDPVDLAIGAGITLATGGFGVAAGLSKLGLIAAPVKKTLGKVIAFGVAEATAQNLISEGINYKSNETLQLEYTKEQVAMNLAAGAFIQAGISGISHRFFGNLTTESAAALSKTMDNQINNGKVPDISMQAAKAIDNLEIDSAISQSVENHLGKEYLEGIETTQQLKAKMLSDESITDKQFNSFFDEMKTSEKLHKFGDKNDLMGMDDIEKKKLVDYNNDPKTDSTYNAAEIEHIDNIIKEKDPEIRLQETAQLYKEQIDQVKKNIDAGFYDAEDVLAIKSIIEENDIIDTHQEGISNFVKCIGGVA